jgi:hypothetical protein
VVERIYADKGHARKLLLLGPAEMAEREARIEAHRWRVEREESQNEQSEQHWFPPSEHFSGQNVASALPLALVGAVKWGWEKKNPGFWVQQLLNRKPGLKRKTLKGHCTQAPSRTTGQLHHFSFHFFLPKHSP